MIAVALASKSHIKLDALREFLIKDQNFNTNTLNIACYEIKNELIPEQPLNDGLECAKLRIEEILTKQKLDQIWSDYIISIENYIDMNCNKDFCMVVIQNKNFSSSGRSNGIDIDPNYLKEVTQHINSKYKCFGSSKTYGSIISREKNVPSDNWMKDINGIDRKDQIIQALKRAMNKIIIKKNFRIEENYPKKGVTFKDICPILSQPGLFRKLIKSITDHYENHKIDFIVGLEARGFILGSALALKLNVGFIPIRKIGKLPGETFKQSYKKEYGEDILEIQKQAFPKNSRILVIDDIVATGGSLEAAVSLIKKLDGVLVDCCVLDFVPELKIQCSALLKDIPLNIYLN